jgi:hypothetical protein
MTLAPGTRLGAYEILEPLEPRTANVSWFRRGDIEPKDALCSAIAVAGLRRVLR